MDDIDRAVVEFEIATQVSNGVMDYKKDGHEPHIILSLYMASVGACMSSLFEEMSASEVKHLCGTWGRKGFLDANSLDLR
jgi:hypothetical protein